VSFGEELDHHLCHHLQKVDHLRTLVVLLHYLPEHSLPFVLLLMEHHRNYGLPTAARGCLRCRRGSAQCQPLSWGRPGDEPSLDTVELHFCLFAMKEREYQLLAPHRRQAFIEIRHPLRTAPHDRSLPLAFRFRKYFKTESIPCIITFRGGIRRCGRSYTSRPSNLGKSALTCKSKEIAGTVSTGFGDQVHEPFLPVCFPLQRYLHSPEHLQI
jgi:hypothetical protein